MVDLFLNHASAPEENILDLTRPTTPLHGEQEGRFFHGYYDCHCYLLLYVSAATNLVAKLCRADIDASGRGR